MKTLFCIIGNLRGGDLPYRSYLSHFGDQHFDLALCVGNTYQDSIWRKHAKYIWEVDESNPNIWEEIYDSIDTKWRNIKHTHNLWGPYKGLSGSGMIGFALREALYHNIIQYNLHYDRYILTRADHFYISNDLPVIEKNTIYSPEGEDYGGICDRFYMCNHDTFLNGLQITKFIINNPDAGNNPESFQKEYHLSLGINIKRFKRTMFCVGRYQEQTRWAKPDIRIPIKPFMNYYAKYLSEIKIILSDNNLSYNDIGLKILK
jgi:hypothetical protein